MPIDKSEQLFDNDCREFRSDTVTVVDDFAVDDNKAPDNEQR